MALKKTIVLDSGLTANGAYIRIDSLSGYKGGLDISVNSYITQEAFNTGQGYLEQKFYSFVPSVEDDAPNFIKQGYEYLRTLSEFDGAIDVLE
ncbi:hypothetical protein ACN6KS_02525 [Paenibacillus nitricinens]|uniref:hypothetical protein n=1 Tax=Paenibacillus nitricinens TaxID=3367691 RepID=UPI003F861153